MPHGFGDYGDWTCCSARKLGISKLLLTSVFVDLINCLALRGFSLGERGEMCPQIPEFDAFVRSPRRSATLRRCWRRISHVYFDATGCSASDPTSVPWLVTRAPYRLRLDLDVEPVRSEWLGSSNIWFCRWHRKRCLGSGGCG